MSSLKHRMKPQVPRQLSSVKPRAENFKYARFVDNSGILPDMARRFPNRCIDRAFRIDQIINVVLLHARGLSDGMCTLTHNQSVNLAGGRHYHFL